MHFQCEPIRDAEIERLIAKPGPARLGPEDRPLRLTIEQIDGCLASIFSRDVVPAERHALARSAVFLWHDHLDASHDISQDIHTPVGSYLHGIMHRREPDFSNAKYWFHRVGAHPCFPLILAGVKSAAKSAAPSALVGRCYAGGHWDPLAFVDACEEVEDRKSGDRDVQFLEAIQEIEFRTLLNEIISR